MTVSIFNNVIGPVMRGPSSSHCAAALRIGRLARNLMDGDIRHVRVEFDRHGALATTHESQGSDMGLCGGLMGWKATDERLPASRQALCKAGIDFRIVIDEFGFAHPNTYRLTLGNEREQHTLTALSTGGGMIEIVEIDGFAVSVAGDYAETLIFVKAHGREIADHLRAAADPDEVLLHETAGGQLVQFKGPAFVDDETLATLTQRYDARSIKKLRPVLPVLSRAGLEVPFATCSAMLRYNRDRNQPLWQLAAAYEAARGNISEKDVLNRAAEVVRIVRVSLTQGLEGTDYGDRILGYQCGRFAQHMNDGELLDAGLLNRIILYVTALMEVKSAMGVIVAAPTAGACAALPGACLGAADALGQTDAETAKALLAGSLIGVFIATNSTFAAEVAGCQAECGAAAGMTAAALATLGGGSTEQGVAAASLALQNSFGMVCDPVANRVEVPCLGKNVMAAANALTCANMALAGYDPVVPLDEVIEAMDQVGRSLPHELRCTALGGLSVTPTSRAIEARLTKQRPAESGERSRDLSEQKGP